MRSTTKKHGGSSFPDQAAVLDIERGQLAGIREPFWQTDTSVSKNSWGYIRNHDYKSVDAIIDDLIDIVSKNGCLLLNIGPKPDGSIPEPEVEMLREIGRWFQMNGDAVYDTRPWKVFGEGPTKVVEGTFDDTKRAAFTREDIRFTTREDTVYAIILGWPTSGRVMIKSMAANCGVVPAAVRLLGCDEKLAWEQTSVGLVINLPKETPGKYAFAFEIDQKLPISGPR